MIFDVNPNEWTLPDSGTRRIYPNGAQRDSGINKGRTDLIPGCAVLRVARQYELGAAKYDEWNWTGLPADTLLDSGIRHLLKYQDGWNDEDHLAAAVFNCFGLMYIEAKRPEALNIPSRQGTELKFVYK